MYILLALLKICYVVADLGMCLWAEKAYEILCWKWLEIYVVLFAIYFVEYDVDFWVLYLLMCYWFVVKGDERYLFRIYAFLFLFFYISKIKKKNL